MAVERAQLLEQFLEDVNIEPGVANGSHHRLLNDTFEDLEMAIQDDGNSEYLEACFHEGGKKILAWWDYNIRSGSARASYMGDATDGSFQATYKHENESAEFTIRVTNGFVDSPVIKSEVDGGDDQPDRNWELIFNNAWIETIKQVIYHEDPEYQRPSTRQILELHHGMAQFRTKPASWGY